MSRVRSTVAATATLALVGGLGLAVGGSPASLADDSPRMQAQSATPPATTYAVIKTISVASGPETIAINDADDTVYVANFAANAVSVIDGQQGLLIQTILLTSGGSPWGVAVDQLDDTVYVTVGNREELVTMRGSNLDDSFLVSLGGEPYGVALAETDDSIYVATDDSLTMVKGAIVSPTVPVGTRAYVVAVNQADDSVYVTNIDSGSVSVLRASNLDDSITLLGFRDPWGVAVNQSDDTVYVANFGNATVSVINGRNTDDSQTIRVGSRPTSVAVDQRDDTVYVANFTDSSTSIINGRQLDDSVVISVSSAPVGMAVDGAGINQGVVYVSSRGDDVVDVIATVSPSISPAIGAEDDTVTVTVDVPQVAYDVDDSTVASVLIGGQLATGLTAGAGDTWTVTAPAGSGTVPVTVTFAGGLTASAGTFTYPSDPPAPVFPPSAPRDVVGTPGDGQATISWTAPASSGSFPITDYEAVVSPGGQSCLVKTPTLSCTITGLTNGTTYTATVRALNGAGWGPTSSPSAPFTPSDGPPTPPGPVPVPPLAPGQDELQVDRVPSPVVVEPNVTTDGLDVSADGWTMTLSGLGADNEPLPLLDDSVLVLEAERSVRATGTEFLPGSRVTLVIDPPTAEGAGMGNAQAPWTIGTVTVKADGSFDGSGILPETVLAGDHILQAVGYSPTGRERALSIGLIVRPWIELNQGTRVTQGRLDRIRTSGDSGGFAAQQTLRPFVLFNAQTQFRPGRATIVIKADGTFTWTRKVRANRSLTAYVAYRDTRSNEVVWPRVRTS